MDDNTTLTEGARASSPEDIANIDRLEARVAELESMLDSVMTPDAWQLEDDHEVGDTTLDGLVRHLEDTAFKYGAGPTLTFQIAGWSRTRGVTATMTIGADEQIVSNVTDVQGRHLSELEPIPIVDGHGRILDLRRPDPSLFYIDAGFAGPLSRIARFGGRAPHFWSVAQHSVLMADHATTPEIAWQCLWHDAHEAFVGDMVSPLKRALPGFRIIEKTWERAVRRWAGIGALDPEVHRLDARALVTEKKLLFPLAGPWPVETEAVPFSTEFLRPLDPLEARDAWLRALSVTWSRLGRGSDCTWCGGHFGRAAT